MEDIEIGPDSSIAKNIWGVSIKAFRTGTMLLISQKAEMEGRDPEDLLDEYEEKNNKIARALMEEIWDESEDLIDQLIHYQMLVVTLALNASGLLEWREGMVEIDELLGEFSE